MNGRVYWITGLSNSGKTTVGTALFYDLKKKGWNVVILDGDLMKLVASGTEEAKYSDDDRHIRAKRYSLMAKLLADQGLCVVICAIAMFDDIREWNRENIKGYIEIFLDVPPEILKARDRKGIFNVSYDDVQYPKSPDIKIINDGSLPLRDIIRQIEMLQPLREDDYDRDQNYWDRYYQKLCGSKIEPSDFAKEVNRRLKPASHIMELGCGNGRDSLFFLSQGHSVIAVDGSSAAINALSEMTKDNDRALFVCDDFVKCHTLYQMQYDCVYSRFTLHSITEEQEDEMLLNAKEAISSGGILCIEARTIHDEIYGKGVRVGKNAFIYNDHFRRFIEVDAFKSKIQNMGFNILYIEEAQGFSKTETSDPVLMRCIASILDSNPGYIS